MHIEEPKLKTTKIAPILIVDDDEIELSLLEKTLLSGEYEVLKADNADDAINILKTTPLSLLISDYQMPGLSGIDLFKVAHEVAPDTPRILVTGNESQEVVLSAINEGKTSFFLHKPWNNLTLLHAAQAGINEWLLKKQAKQMEEQLLEQFILLSENHQRIKSELAIGKHIYDQLLVDHPPESNKHYHANSLSIPSKDLDGDFTHFYSPTTHILDLAIGDVMGKGLPATLIGVTIKENIKRLTLPRSDGYKKTPVRSLVADLFQVEEITQQIHNELSEKLIRIEFFSALLYGRFDYKKNIFIYSNCGLPRPIHYKSKEKTFSYLSGKNPAIGIVEEYQFESCEIHFEKDDIFFFYSDGATEALNCDSQSYFGDARLKESLENNINKEASTILDRIYKEICSFTESEKTSDDLTLLVVKIGEPCSDSKS